MYKIFFRLIDAKIMHSRAKSVSSESLRQNGGEIFPANPIFRFANPANNPD